MLPVIPSSNTHYPWRHLNPINCEPDASFPGRNPSNICERLAHGSWSVISVCTDDRRRKERRHCAVLGRVFSSRSEIDDVRSVTSVCGRLTSIYDVTASLYSTLVWSNKVTGHQLSARVRFGAHVCVSDPCCLAPWLLCVYARERGDMDDEAVHGTQWCTDRIILRYTPASIWDWNLRIPRGRVCARLCLYYGPCSCPPAPGSKAASL